MADWPKTVFIKGIGIPVTSWDELDEIIQRYGSQMFVTIPSEQEPRSRGAVSSGRVGPLTHSDRNLLKQFVDGGVRGLSNRDLALALGREGRAIKPALDEMGMRVGLVNEGGQAFAPVMRADGRGYRLTDVHIRIARSILGMEE